MVIFLILLISPDAKAWMMRQVLSTGLLNSKIERRSENKSPENNSASVPNFSVVDAKGKITDVSGLKGKVVFINFWASWCPPCRAEFPSIQKFYNQYKGNENLIFLTVNLDDETGKGKEYLLKENLSIPFLVPAGDIPKEYFGGSLPTTVVLDKSGAIRMHHAGMADYSKDSFHQQINALLNE